MLLLVAAAAALSAPQSAPRAQPAVAVQARATVRIVRAAVIRFGGQRNVDVPAPRSAQIRTIDGPKLARLIEFE